MKPHSLAAIAGGLALAVCAAAWPAAAAPAVPPGDPARLADAIEQRADKTSFADLERFGDEARRIRGREALRRLQHVALIMLNQSEFERFAHWNGLLEATAVRQGDHRYEIIARLNALKVRHDQGDTSVRGEIERLAAAEPDWYARIYAVSVQSMVLIDQGKTGQALKLLSQAEDLIPAGDPDAAGAESTIWETIGLALMDLDDLEGSAKAFQRADFEFSEGAYPRPDFDGVYNMAHLAVNLGDGPLSRRLAAIHHRLAVRSDLPHLKPWDDNLCAMVAEAFGEPAEVLDCLKSLDRKLTGAEFLAPRLLSMRAIAEARLGQVDAARDDLDRYRRLRASGQFEDQAFDREGLVEAELLAAEGDRGGALDAMRRYERAHDAATAHKFAVGMRQVTGSLQTQLETARLDATLQAKVIRSQRWVGL
ncbi:MAG TPA: hybrid sensor histidine kinase/response regulator, partial [Caulobacteraceae bacterium]|nr:hybrid sensor histidine kinase/response regulator [Caulobacteraceae bacterium]